MTDDEIHYFIIEQLENSLFYAEEQRDAYARLEWEENKATLRRIEKLRLAIEYMRKHLPEEPILDAKQGGAMVDEIKKVIRTLKDG